VSSAEFRGHQNDGQSQPRKDLPNTPADGAGGAASEPVIGPADKSGLVPQLPRDNGQPKSQGDGRPARPIPALNRDRSSFGHQVPADAEHTTGGGHHKDKAEENKDGKQGVGAGTAQDGPSGNPVEVSGATPAAGAGEGSGFGNGSGDGKITGGGGEHGEPDPDAPDNTDDAADEWLKSLTGNGSAEKVLFEDNRKGEEQRETSEFPPDDLKALAAYIGVIEGRLQEVAPFTIPQDGDIRRPEDDAVDEFEALFLEEPGEDADRGESERLHTAMGRAAYEIEAVALSLFEGDLGDENHYPALVIGKPQDSMMFAKLHPLKPEAQQDSKPLYTWQSDLEIGDTPKLLVVETAKGEAEKNDDYPEGYKADNTVIRLTYHLLPGGEVQLIDTAMEHVNDAGEIDTEQNDLLSTYLDQAPDAGISLSVASDAFRLTTALIEVESAYAIHRSMQNEENRGVARDVPAVVPTAEAGVSPISERDLAIKDARDGIFTTVKELMQQQDASRFTAEAATTGEAVLAMMELNAQQEKEAINKTQEFETLDDELAALTDSASVPTHEKQSVSNFVEGLENLPGVPLETLAKAYLIDGSVFQGNDSQIKLHAILSQEKKRRLDPKNAGLENTAARTPELLDEVARECAILGIDPHEWIAQYAADDDDAWRLRAVYYYTIKKTGKEEDPRLDAHHLSLTDRKVTSAELAYKYTDAALETSENPALNVALMQQFPDVASNVEITAHNVDKLFTVAQEVLKATTAEMLLDEGNITIVKGGEMSELESEKKTLVGKFDALIDDMRRSPKGEYDERSALVDALIKGQFTWRMSLKAIKGDEPEEIVDAVKEEEAQGFINRNAVLDAVATQYAAHGDFESAQKILAHVQPDVTQEMPPIETAYVHVWNRAASLDDLQYVDPSAQQTTEAPISPLLSADYISVAALLSGSTSVMKQVALDIASDLQKGWTSVQEFSHRDQQWNMLEQFIKTTKEVAGKDDKQKGIDEAVTLSRELFAVFAQVGTLVDVEEMAPIIDVLAKNGDARDWHAIRILISNQPISDIEKIKLFSRFASAIE
jgi:hypothetical protein